eukprot:TRINITY_DN776199_c0_g1_i1.p1 TRINITY_DN776199_c0_g1~~TRINITY_DN776199_c0_g1_i1.p1  ORF type:complete len:188 (-),score=55.21 TRINITY_DN776199_c0_g1_i1:243-806(-)
MRFILVSLLVLAVLAGVFCRSDRDTFKNGCGALRDGDDIDDLEKYNLDYVKDFISKCKIPATMMSISDVGDVVEGTDVCFACGDNDSDYTFSTSPCAASCDDPDFSAFDADSDCEDALVDMIVEKCYHRFYDDLADNQAELIDHFLEEFTSIDYVALAIIVGLGIVLSVGLLYVFAFVSHYTKKKSN